jgi:ATP-dependent protease ClpP protease subunit
MKIQWQAPIKALEKWQPEIRAASSGDNEIDMYDIIGEGLYTQGVTLNYVSNGLKKANKGDVVVNINSAGGDMFEGLAIYNLLKEYEGRVTVKIMGMAASAASIIAMAGDDIEIGESAFFMIHNAWSVAIGNKNDFTKAADDFAKFDDAMALIYSKKTGKDYDEIVSMMDDETWISGKDSVDMGFATSLLDDDDISEVDSDKSAKALRKIDTALAKAGVTRSERRDLLKELNSTPSATDNTTPSASDEVVEALKSLQNTIQNLTKGN